MLLALFPENNITTTTAGSRHHFCASTRTLWKKKYLADFSGVRLMSRTYFSNFFFKYTNRKTHFWVSGYDPSAFRMTALMVYTS